MERFRNSNSKFHREIIGLSKSKLSGIFLKLLIEVSSSFYISTALSHSFLTEINGYN